MNQFLNQDIKFLSGVGPKRAELLNKELQIFTFEDLLLYYPFKYIDRSKVYTISQIDTTVAYIQLRGSVMGFKKEGKWPKERLIVKFKDNTGTIDLIFFEGVKYVLGNLKVNAEYIMLGKPSVFNGQINFVHPELEEAIKFESSIAYSLQPFYNTTEKLKSNFITSRIIQKLLNTLWQNIGEIPETLPPYIIQQAHFL